MLSFEYEDVKWGNEFSLPAAGVGTGGGATLFGAGNGLEAEWKGNIRLGAYQVNKKSHNTSDETTFLPILRSVLGGGGGGGG